MTLLKVMQGVPFTNGCRGARGHLYLGLAMCTHYHAQQDKTKLTQPNAIAIFIFYMYIRVYAIGICYVATLFIPTEYCRIEWYVGCTRLGQDHHVHFQSP